MTEYVYKLKNGKVVSAYADENGNMTITKEALEIIANSWNDGYQKGFQDGVDITTEKAQKSNWFKEEHIEDFIDFINENGTNQEITDDNDLRDFLQEQFDFYKEQKWKKYLT